MAEKTKSAIWKHFVKVSPQEATCTSCNAKLRTPSSTTTPLANHLKSRHHGLHNLFLAESGKQKSFPSATQPTIKSKFEQPKELPLRRRAEITAKIARMLALDLQPYDFVESRGFKELMHELEPLYKIPCRTTFSRTVVPELYKDTVRYIKGILHADLQEGIQSLSFTSDMWTSKANDSYTSLTCHYLTPSFELRAFALSNTLMTDSHTASNILAHLQEMMAEWELPLDKLPVYFVSDNARNYRAALRSLQCTALQCLGHTLQLAIKDSKETTPGVPDILKKCRAIVGHYKHSTKATTSLQECQRQLELPTLKLVQDVETRWNSEHDMLSRLLQLKAAVCLELATSDTTIANLTPQEWRTIEGLVKALEPVASATKDLSGQKYATLSSVIPFLYGTEMILKECIAADDTTSLFAKNMLKAMKARFVGYSQQKEYVLATACDPRFKHIFCTEAAQEMILVEFAHSELEKSAPPCDRPGPSAPVPSTSERDTGIWDRIEKLAKSSGQKQLHGSSSIDEFRQYLREPTCGRNEDPLAYWRTSGKQKYPSVSTLAMKYLGIPATQVPSEKLFSTAGNIVTARREKLSPEHVQQLLFLHENL